jgi:hypothetical protein
MLGNVFTYLFPRNGPIYHITPLRLFVPNSLTVYHHFLFSEGYACGFFLWLGVSPPPTGSDHSPTATTTHPLSALISSGTLLRFGQNRFIIFIQNFLFSHSSRGRGGAAKLSHVASASTLLAPALYAVSVSVLEGINPSSTSDPCFLAQEGADPSTRSGFLLSATCFTN